MPSPQDATATSAMCSQPGSACFAASRRSGTSFGGRSWRLKQGERDGFLSIDDVMRDADALLEEMAGPQR